MAPWFRMRGRGSSHHSVCGLSGCSAIKGSPEGTWRVNFFTDPDRVWGAIELSLLELDYEVTKENRYDGVLRAKSEPAEDGTVIALAIDQVVNTESQVSVYVKPSFAGDEGSTDPDLLKSAADEFVKELKIAVVARTPASRLLP